MVSESHEAFKGLETVIERLGAEKEDLEEELYRRVGSNLMLMRGVVDTTAGIPEGVRLRLSDRVAVLGIVQGLIGAHGIGADRRFTELCKGLAAYFGVNRSEGGRNLRVTAHSSGGPLLFSEARNLGLILGEFMQNSYDHAFPKGGPGSVSIEFDSSLGGGLRLEYRDSGIGLPEGIGPERGGAGGLFLVRALVAELGGTLTAEQGQGCAWVLTVPPRVKRRSS